MESGHGRLTLITQKGAINSSVLLLVHSLGWVLAAGVALGHLALWSYFRQRRCGALYVIFFGDLESLLGSGSLSDIVSF